MAGACFQRRERTRHVEPAVTEARIRSRGPQVDGAGAQCRLELADRGPGLALQQDGRGTRDDPRGVRRAPRDEVGRLGERHRGQQLLAGGQEHRKNRAVATVGTNARFREELAGRVDGADRERGGVAGVETGVIRRRTVAAGLGAVVAGGEDRQDLGGPPGVDETAHGAVAAARGQRPGVDQDVGLADGEHPVGALGQEHVVVMAVGQSGAGDPLRSRSHPEGLPRDVARDRHAQDAGAVTEGAVDRLGASAGRVVPGRRAAAKAVAQLLVDGAGAGVDETHDHAAAVEPLPPGTLGADRRDRPGPPCLLAGRAAGHVPHRPLTRRLGGDGRHFRPASELPRALRRRFHH